MTRDARSCNQQHPVIASRYRSIVCVDEMKPFIYLWRGRQSGNSRASVIFVPKQNYLSGLKSLKFTVIKKKKWGWGTGRQLSP